MLEEKWLLLENSLKAEVSMGAACVTELNYFVSRAAFAQVLPCPHED